MDFYNVIFPLNIGILTYRCPDSLSDSIKSGMIVSAFLKNKITKGIVAGKSSEMVEGDIKDIQEIHGDTIVLSDKMLTLLKWMSDYYMAEEGLVLRNILPKEAFTKVRRRKTKKSMIPHVPSYGRHLSEGGLRSLIKDPRLDGMEITSNIFTAVTRSLDKGTYKAFLLHAPSSAYEYSLLMEMLSKIRDGIILVPELSFIRSYFPRLSELLGERLCLLHSDLSKGERTESIEKILSGHSDIVLGTRSAVFAPLQRVSCIAVLHEHNNSYKQENSPCYSARDIAVMRGYLEKSTVLLSSISPSVESFYNCKSGKYTLLKPAGDLKKPKIKVMDMRYEKAVKPYLAKRVVDTAVRYTENGKKVMFVMNRRGHSTLLQCRDCHYIEECPACRIPLVFHKQDLSLKCHYCGTTASISERCSRCRGFNLELLGAGTQQVQEDLEQLTGIKTIRLDSDRTKKKSESEGLIKSAFTSDTSIVIGTKLLTRRIRPACGFSMAAVLNTDVLLNIPDFRSAERAYQEITSIIDNTEPDGEVFIQTRMPQNYLYKSLKNYDYHMFFREELNRRKALLYPPFSKLLLMKLISKKDISARLSETIFRMRTMPHQPSLVKVEEREDFRTKHHDPEILGPYLSRDKQGRNQFRLLLKSSVRGNLHSTAKRIIETFKDSKDIKIKVDVDPIVI